ncbi:AAA family ATPase [Actinomadura sp. NPDC000600]|uniref:ATP-binding protein n=1 Tax=Actinomadura sp. NPDC000600 TaxID=3154262 RepID=UPI00339B31FD
MLYGRDGELAAIDELLGRARAGRSGVLVLRGEAGIGKSALLDHAAGAADGMRVLRGTGFESESGMPYAGLHLLLGRHLDRIAGLPEGQAEALRAALNMGGPEAESDRFLVGLAVLTLLSDLAEERPLLCLVDDAHWIDGSSAEALLFAARRLDAEPIAIVFAARDADAPEPASPESAPPEFVAEGLPELRLHGLDGDAAAALLAERAPTCPAMSGGRSSPGRWATRWRCSNSRGAAGTGRPTSGSCGRSPSGSPRCRSRRGGSCCWWRWTTSATRAWW